mmetsp:Transcript_5361/g.16391  ORF Transcript_5361/g.16391 Transcript_5361/m.16391 type:complete len:264 (-) Transcript_5361:318-1109(-)
MGGRAASAYSACFYAVLSHIYASFKGCVDDITRWAGRGHFEEWAKAIFVAGAPAQRCIGFIDGTFRACARPTDGHLQRLLHSGYYKSHGFKFQAVVAPNGLIVDLYGCCAGRRHDSYMLSQSGFLRRMQTSCTLEAHAGGRRGQDMYYVYGDPAYGRSRYVMRGAKGAMSNRARRTYAQMNGKRVAVEWKFCTVIQEFSFVDNTKILKAGEMPLARIYYVAALLSNMKVCLNAERFFDTHGGLISRHFNVSPPSLNAFLYGPL